VVHAHFYQPSRVDPFTGRVPREPSAAPFHDWNERINAECYRPNAERGNLEKISFDIGPTLATWLREADPETHARFVAADTDGETAHGGNAIAQAYHHSILPLASMRDRRTEIRWGIREFELRFGRRPTGLWLPETAVDLPSLRLLAEHGITHTVLAPWQTTDAEVETRRPYRVSLGGGRSMVIVYFDGPLSAAVSFDANATIDAESFGHLLLAPRFAQPMGDGRPGGGSGGASRRSSAHPGPASTPEVPTILLASDGEFYGHHQKFRDLFLQRLLGADGSPPPRDYQVVNLATVVADEPEGGYGTTHVSERTAWSCHHGIQRWTGECPCAADGRWKGPLRQALDRLAAGIDQVTEHLLPEAITAPAFWEARDAYVEVLQGATEPDAFLERHLDGRTARALRERVLDLLEAQRWRLAMFASDGWFWDEPSRLETQQILRAAARAVRIVDGYAGTALERRLGEDLGLLSSPARHIDGYEIYREALADVGQPLP
jgi:hypothetical protein